MTKEPDTQEVGAELFPQVSREPRLSDKVTELIRETIISRGLAPGTQLPSERELGEQFGVSRTVVREAVRALAAKGVVEVRSGSGLRVAAFDGANVSESLSWYIRGGGLEYPKVHEVRSMVEVEMAGLAATRRTEAELAALTQSHALFESVIDQVEEAARVDVEFHATIAEATQNELFQIILSSMSEALIEIRRENLSAPGGAGSRTVAEHQRVLDAITERDADAARTAMRDHLESVRKTWESFHEDGQTAFAEGRH
jgi:GntR family transcriptional repressor for pyruvate dehydrogenase complex